MVGHVPYRQICSIAVIKVSRYPPLVIPNAVLISFDVENRVFAPGLS
jgi:hypothetical protein